MNGLDESSVITSRRVAEVLNEIADLLEAKRVPFKPIAYRRAARAVLEQGNDIAEIVRRGELEDIPGVGKHIAAKIGELVTTGNLAYLDRLRSEVPKGIADLATIEGIGPKRAMILSEKLGITETGGLEAAAKEGKIRTLPGFGEKSEQKILKAIRLRQGIKGRYLVGDILPVAGEIERQIALHPAVRQVSIAGSARRRRETIGDLDLVATSPEPGRVMTFFCSLPQVGRVIEQGPTRSTVVLASGLQVDLRVVPAASFGAALQYFTGSKDHNIALRRRASAQNRKLNEYGLTNLSTGQFLAGKDEEEVYRALGLPLIPPEIRENKGEIAAAEAGTLPALVGYDSVQGDLHVHSDWSNGTLPITEMALAAQKMGYAYIAICDRTKGPGVPHGITTDDVAAQQKEIVKVNRALDGFSVLAGIECSIGNDGKPDMPHAILKDIDLVIAGIHDGVSRAGNDATTRLINAIHDDAIDIIAHPTGRILGKRDPLDLDLPAVCDAAAGAGVLLEINACRSRLDPGDEACRVAKDHGVRFSLGTGARTTSDLADMQLGIATARRGWLTAQDIVNTLEEKDLRAVFRK